jgi:signal transduction histidine kinase
MSTEYRALLPAVLLADAGPVTRVSRTARDWVVDALFFLFATGMWLALAVDGAHRVGPVVHTVDCVLGALACLGVWLRRRWPVWYGLAACLIGVFAVTSFGAGLVALFTVVVHRRFAVAVTVTAVSVAAGALFPLVRPDWNAGRFSDQVFGLVISAAVFAWGMFVRARRQLVLSLRERARRAESEQQLRVAQARQAERARIAREMHDVLAHRISLLSLHAGALEYRPDAPPEEVARAAKVIRDSAHQALHDLREVIGVLREDPADDHPDRPQPTLADLPGLVDESRQAGMRVRLAERVAEPGAVPDAVGRNAYRVVQEGLTNARKHARGSAVEVSVDGEPGAGLTIELRNRLPVGAYAAAGIPGTGTGIVGLAERASLAGGRLEHGRTDAGDYRLWAWLPWPA